MVAIICILGAVAVAACSWVVYGIIAARKAKRVLSFKESFDLTELPVVTFTQKNQRINFLLDTGSTNSIVNKEVLDNYKYEPIKAARKIMGMEGNQVVVPLVKMIIARKDVWFEGEFQVVDMSKAFAELKMATGVTVHGILGNDFFTKYNAVLDFDNYIAYFK
jgi:hypothetical protein